MLLSPGETKIRKYPGKPRPMRNGEPVNENSEPGELQMLLKLMKWGVHENKFILGVKSHFVDRGFDRAEVFLQMNILSEEKQRSLKYGFWVEFRHTLY